MCCGTEAGSHLRLIDSCITQLKAQGPSRTCNVSKEEVKKHTLEDSRAEVDDAEGRRLVVLDQHDVLRLYEGCGFSSGSEAGSYFEAYRLLYHSSESSSRTCNKSTEDEKSLFPG